MATEPLTQEQIDTWLGKERSGDLSPDQQDAIDTMRAAGQFPAPLSSLDPIDTIEGYGRAYVQGGLAGSGDEVVAGGVALKNELFQLAPETFQSIGDFLGLPGSFSSVDRPMGEVYDASLADQRARLDQFRDEQPIAAYGSEIVGSIPTALLGGGVGAAKAATPLASRMLRASAIGGLEGAGYGFLSGEGGLEARAGSAGEGGLFGAALGPAFPVAGDAVRAGYNQTIGRLVNRLLQPDTALTPAQDVVLRAARADDAIGEAGRARIQAAGDDAMVADAGPALVQVLDAAMQTGGPALRRGTDRVSDRVERASSNITSTLDNTLGAPVGTYTAETAIRRGSAGARGDAYAAAYEQAIDYSSDAGVKLLDIIESRVPEQAIRQANELMRMELGRGSRQIMADIADDGTVAYREVPDVMQIDYITRGLNAVAASERNKSLIGAQTPIGMATENLTREIRDIVRNMVPEYDNALKTAATTLQRVDALRLGESALRTTTRRDQFIAELGNMTEAQLEYVKQGIRAHLDELMSNTRRTITSGSETETQAALRAIKDLSSRANREKITAVLGADEAASMFKAIDQAATAFELRAGVARNSATAARREAQEETSEQVRGTIPATIRRGEALGLPKRLWQEVFGGTPADEALAHDQANDLIVDLLTQSGPEGQKALDALINRQAARNPSMVPGVIGQIAQGTVPALANIGPAPLSDMLRGR